jgi:phage terminase large subunit GpA-like protein
VNSAIDAADPLCGWVQTATFNGIAGFMELNELYSCLPGVGVANLVADYLEAEYYAERGDDNKRIVFINSKLGQPYKYKDDRPEASEFGERAVADPESQRPEGLVARAAYILTAGIDVQDNRLAFKVKAWGVGEESWLVVYNEIHAVGSTVDETDPVWKELEKSVFRAFEHEEGKAVYVRAVSIDSGGHATDAVYKWVRKMRKRYPGRHIMPVKGSSHIAADPEIFVRPAARSIDHKKPEKQSKADRYGLKVFLVGTGKAKDLISGRMQMSGSGPGRMHYCRAEDRRADYFDQMTSEAKIPSKRIRHKKVWERKSGAPSEAWDCEVYALHAARACRVHLMDADDWDKIRGEVLQNDMFETPDQISTKDLPSAPPPRRQSDYWNRE